MRGSRAQHGWGLVVAPMSVAVLAAPATAAPPVHDSYRISGDLAEAIWFAEADVPLGTPVNLFVMGADATTVQHSIGGRPQRSDQPAIIAMGMMMPGATAGDEPYPAELWCVADDASFVIADDLSSAELSIEGCAAQVVVVDPETGEEGPNGVMATISASVLWTAVGELEAQRTHSRDEMPGGWSMDMARTEARPARAEITVTGLPGGMFNGEDSGAVLQNVKEASLHHG